LSAEEALEWGLVTRVVDDDDLLPAAVEFASKVAHHSPLALANVKRVMTHGFLDGTGAGPAMQVERETTLRYCLTSSDAPEGLAAVVRIPTGPVNTNPEEAPVAVSNCATGTPEEFSTVLPTTN